MPHVVVPALGGHDHGDAGQVSSAERYESHSAAATQQLLRHYDSENPSSEDEEEEGDLQLHEPFPSESIRA